MASIFRSAGSPTAGKADLVFDLSLLFANRVRQFLVVRDAFDSEFSASTAAVDFDRPFAPEPLDQSLSGVQAPDVLDSDFTGRTSKQTDVLLDALVRHDVSATTSRVVHVAEEERRDHDTGSCGSKVALNCGTQRTKGEDSGNCERFPPTRPTRMFVFQHVLAVQ